MKYEINQTISLEEGNFYKVRTEVHLESGFTLRPGYVLRIIKLSEYRIDFTYYLQPNDTDGLTDSVDGGSPGEQVLFETFLLSLGYISTSELDETCIPYEDWPKYRLIEVIEFLDKQIDDLNADPK